MLSAVKFGLILNKFPATTENPYHRKVNSLLSQLESTDVFKALKKADPNNTLTIEPRENGGEQINVYLYFKASGALAQHTNPNEGLLKPMPVLSRELNIRYRSLLEKATQRLLDLQNKFKEMQPKKRKQAA